MGSRIRRNASSLRGERQGRENGSGRARPDARERRASPTRLTLLFPLNEVGSIFREMYYETIGGEAEETVRFISAITIYAALYITLFTLFEERLQMDPAWRTAEPVLNLDLRIGIANLWRMYQFVVVWANRCVAFEAALIIACTDVPTTVLLSHFTGAGTTNTVIQAGILFCSTYIPFWFLRKRFSSSTSPVSDLVSRLALSMAGTIIFVAMMGCFYAICSKTMFERYDDNAWIASKGKVATDWYSEWIRRTRTLLPYGCGLYEILVTGGYRKAKSNDAKNLAALNAGLVEEKDMPTARQALALAFAQQRTILTLLSWHNTLMQLYLYAPSGGLWAHYLWSVAYTMPLYVIGSFYKCVYVDTLPDSADENERRDG